MVVVEIFWWALYTVRIHILGYKKYSLIFSLNSRFINFLLPLICLTILNIRNIVNLMPKSQKGSVVIIILLVFIILVGSFMYYQYLSKGFGNKDKNISINSDNSEKSKSKPAEVSNGWQTFDYKYGQMKINYPPGWLVKYDIERTSSYRPIDFIPPQKGSVITTGYIISFNVYVAQKPYYSESSSSTQYYNPPPPRNNFNIPALGEGMNAYFSQGSGSTAIYLTRNSVDYVLTANIAKALELKMDPAEITSILTQMSKSIQFTQDLGSCDDPVLQPLSSFPDNFILSNYHDSDKSDKPTGYWPNVSLDGNYNDIDGLQQKANYGSKRYFLVSYAKEGEPFTTNSNFEQTVVSIQGGDYYSISDNQTILIYVNCADKVQSGYPVQFFYIGNDGINKFEVPVYGAFDNSRKLWGLDKWNINLLKKTRNSVYIKMGNKWQKYSANNYYVAL